MSLSQLRSTIVGVTVFLGALLVMFGCAVLALRLLLWHIYDVPLLPY